jgi:signal transduction histidine kinase
MSLEAFFLLNRPLILFLYGQVFFVLGLAIFLQSRRHSRLRLARDLRWLALFGILHGLHEWGLVFIPLQTAYLTLFWIELLLAVQVWLLAGSFICLLIFGVRLLEAKFNWMRWLSAVLIGGWLLIFSFPSVVGESFVEWAYLSSVFARYMLGFSGAMLAAYGLYVLAHTEVVLTSGRKFYQMLRLAGGSLFAYAVFGGILVSQGSFFPANFINQQLLEGWVHLPVEVWRSLSGFVLAISIIRALEIFDVEVDRLIEGMEIEAIQSAERERIGQEIHDGAMQGVYSVSLILNSMGKQVDELPIAAARLSQAQQVLTQVIRDLRHYMTSLRSTVPQKSVAEELKQLAAQPRFSSLVDIQLDLADMPTLEGVDSGRLLSLVQEALSNVVRHADATIVTICLYPEDDHFILTIVDNGRGFDLNNIQPGYGLRTMKEQARMMGTELEIISAPGKGTTYKMKCPQKEME